MSKAATLREIQAQGWSLNPGRSVGIAIGEAVSDEAFREQLEPLNEELEILKVQARQLETTIAINVAEILEVLPSPTSKKGAFSKSRDPHQETR